VVADVVLSGHVPRIKRAIGLVARGTQRGLRTTSVRGMADIDPESQDFFRRVIELRKTVERDPSIGSDEGRRLSRFLKVFASAASYGILAEFQRRESADPVDVSVYADGDCFDTSTPDPRGTGALLLSSAGRCGHRRSPPRAGTARRPSRTSRWLLCLL
jgi:hypothetical protein